jgi:F-type H+-transporting ATPase subunit epsilon
MATLHVDVVSAEAAIFTGEAKFVVLPGEAGELGILPGHTPLLGVLVEGDVRIQTGGATNTATIDSGFLSVDRDKVIIVAEAVDASQISA